ncbi:MAG: tol-pal system protein YbgF [Pseudomonadota bacterium]|nr:tol-pal system protein YbgF [Pseudomonadota bacterium]
MAVLAFVVFLACFVPAGGEAQNNGMQELLNRVDRLQRELTTLQRQVYQGKTPPVPAGQSFSAPAVAPMAAARHSIRISQLENEISRLTGRLEEVDFALRRIEERLDKLVIDLDQRLTVLEGRTAGTGAAGRRKPNPALPEAEQELKPSAQQTAPNLTLPTRPASPSLGASQPGVLGTIPKNLAVRSPRGPDSVAAAPAPKSPLPPGTPKSQYDYALSLLLKQQDFGRAEEALKAFVKQHPRDNLTGNAQYWLGETYYVRNRYEDAAFAFAEGYQKFSKNVKAPDSLLKLGMSLGRMEKRREACTAFARFLLQYPKASARLKARIDRERRQAKCR